MPRKPEPPAIVEYRTPDGDRILGYWVGEPERSTFIQTGESRDRRGLTDGAKRRIRADTKAQAAMRHALSTPHEPDAETARKHRVPQSALPPPHTWGSLEYWRDLAAHAEERVRLLESQRDYLLQRLYEQSEAVRYLVEAPAEIAKKNAGKPRKSRYAAEFPEWERVAIATLRADPDAECNDIAREIKRLTKTTAALRMITTWCVDNERRLHIASNAAHASNSPLSV